MSFRKIREKLNVLLYNSKEKVLSIFKITHLFISIISLLTLVIFFGYTLDETTVSYLLLVIQFSFAFYIFRFIIRYVYDFNPKQFIKENKLELSFLIYLIIEGVYYNITGRLAITDLSSMGGVEGVGRYSIVFLQVFFFGFILFEYSKGGGVNPFYRLHPATIFISSFFFIILVGTGMLMMPEMTTSKDGMNFLDAFFMSTSATCVTGLSLVDVSDFYTFKGQFVLLILMKLGGLNIILFGAFLLLASRLGVGVKQHDLIEDFVNKDSILSTRGTLGRIIIWSISIEIIGAIFMYFTWGNDIKEFTSTSGRMFYSVFHSVSAFNNAGFSLFTDGLYNEQIRDNDLIQLAVTGLVFLGALGMASIFDIFSIRKLKDRFKNPWKRLELGTKIALNYSLIFVGVGLVLFFILEFNNTLEGKSLFGKIVHSLFQSVTRTSGFNSVDIGSVTTPVLIMFCFLMFVGSSSSSTGGGIKTSTFAVLWATTMSTIKGKKHIELYKRTIGSDIALKAFSVLLFFIVGNLLGIFILTITEHELLAKESVTLSDIIFEEVSAFSTVGLSTGVTADISSAGKVVLVCSMFIGRVGTLTVGFFVGRKMISTNYKYPKGHTMIG